MHKRVLCEPIDSIERRAAALNSSQVRGRPSLENEIVVAIGIKRVPVILTMCGNLASHNETDPLKGK